MPSIHHSAFRIHHFDMRFKILVGIYVVVLAVIIFLANRRDTAHLFRFIRELPFGDKIGHLVLMGFLSFLVNLALSAKVVKIWRFNVLLGSIIVFAVVLVEEISQRFVKTRTFDLVDLLFDFIGIFIFGELARWLVKRKAVKS